MRFISAIITGFYTAWWNFVPRLGLSSTGYFKAWFAVHLVVLALLVTGNITEMWQMSVIATFYVLLSLGTTMLRMAINHALALGLDTDMTGARSRVAEDREYQAKLSACIAKHKTALEEWRANNPKATTDEWQTQARKQMHEMAKELREYGASVTEIPMDKDDTDNNRLH